MTVVRIAHISDLHFAPGKTLAVWREVAKFINAEVKPHLVLVTGDVTDNAKRCEFEIASAELGRLAPQQDGDRLVYRIIPGNHDRFALLGNTFWFIGRWGHVKDKEGRFDSSFTDHIVTADDPFDIEFPAGQSPWRLRIIGLDSNDATQFFAQGYVSQPLIAKAATAARDRADRDLVIALVHHHVLPIPALEIERGARKAGLKLLPNVTGLLNSGSLLNYLSVAHVDLILHGHEHKRSQARFGSLEDGASNMVVLAAGSGTGAATGGDFELSRVHFNVLELHEDRSTWLQEVGVTNAGTLGYTSERRLLLTAQEIRQSRFVRRNRQAPAAQNGATPAFPRSRLKKLVRFSEQRDIEITETRTDWVVGDPWTQVTRNSSGQLSALLVECQWTAGPMDEYRAEFLPQRGEPDRFVSSVQLVRASGKKAERITSSWIWHGGATLTLSDLETLRDTLADPIRLDGREYAAVRANGEFESLSITVQLPFVCAPHPEEVKVLIEDPARPSVLLESRELEKSLDFCGRSILELRVPYPMPNFTYYVTWPVAKDGAVAGEILAFIAAAKTHIKSMLSVANQHLSRRLEASKLRIGLYAPTGANSAILERISEGGQAVIPGAISRRDPRGVGRLAWWGSPAVAVRDKDGPSADAAEREFCEDERILVVVPVRGSDQLGTAALALLRVGIRGPLVEASAQGKSPVDLDVLTALVVEAASLVLAMGRQNY